MKKNKNQLSGHFTLQETMKKSAVKIYYTIYIIKYILIERNLHGADNNQ